MAVWLIKRMHGNVREMNYACFRCHILPVHFAKIVLCYIYDGLEIERFSMLASRWKHIRIHNNIHSKLAAIYPF